MTTLAEKMINGIREEVENNEWDVKPGVALVVQTDGTGGYDTYETFELGGMDMLWSAADSPVDVLEVMARAAKHNPPPEPNFGKLVGFMFACEGWALASPKHPTPEQVEATKQVGRDHMIHVHPDRVETKMVSVVLANGDRYGIRWDRGSEEPEVITPDTPGDKDGINVSGRVYDALELLASTIGTRKES